MSVGAGVTIGPGTTVTRTGSFADPGADTWTASVDYGDGSGPHPLALNPDKTFALGHTYSQPGSFAVAVWVKPTRTAPWVPARSPSTSCRCR